MLLFSNTTQASTLRQDIQKYSAGEEQRLEAAGELLLNEMLDEIGFPEYILDYINVQINILSQRIQKNPTDVDSPARIKMLEYAKSHYLKYRKQGIAKDPVL